MQKQTERSVDEPGMQTQLMGDMPIREYTHTRLVEDEKCYLELLTDGKDSDFRININHTPFCIGRPWKSGYSECDNEDFPPESGGRGQVSRRHCQIKYEKEMSTYLIEDLDSANGTSVNGKRIMPYNPVEIHHRDQIAFGKCRFVFISGKE